MTTSPVLGIPMLDDAQAGKVEQVNRALRHIEAAVPSVIESDALASPPGSPADGVAYIVAVGGIGDWAGHDGKIAFFRNGTWKFVDPVEGLVKWVKNRKCQMAFADSEWFPTTPQRWATKHWTGKYWGTRKVQAKCFENIALPSSASVSIPHGVTPEFTVVGAEPQITGFATFAGGTILLPSVDVSANIAALFVDPTNIVISTSYAASALHASIRMEFVEP